MRIYTPNSLIIKLPQKLDGTQKLGAHPPLSVTGLLLLRQYHVSLSRKLVRNKTDATERLVCSHPPTVQQQSFPTKSFLACS